MDPLVRILGFITSVLCPTNSNRHFPLLTAWWATGLDPQATLPCFSNIIFKYHSPSQPQELFGFYYTSGLSYPWWCVWWNSVAGACERGWKDPRRTSDISLWCGMIPSGDDPLSARLVLSCFPPPRGWVIWPLSTFGPDPFLTNHTYGMISGWGPWPRTKFPCVDFSTVDICAELVE